MTMLQIHAELIEIKKAKKELDTRRKKLESIFTKQGQQAILDLQIQIELQNLK